MVFKKSRMLALKATHDRQEDETQSFARLWAYQKTFQYIPTRIAVRLLVVTHLLIVRQSELIKGTAKSVRPKATPNTSIHAILVNERDMPEVCTPVGLV